MTDAMPLALGIDIGTSGVRTAVVNPDGSLVSMARSDHVPQPADKIDAQLWWKAVEECLMRQMDALKTQKIDPAHIKGIAVDGTSGSMVLTDRALVPVSGALMYNSKGFEVEAEQIARHAEKSHITQGGNSALARAMRLVRDAYGAPAHLMHQADFITAMLMGRAVGSDYHNALKTGFDPQFEAWPDWVAQVIDPALLPQVHAPGHRLGVIQGRVATRLGLSAQTAIYAGTTDSVAAFLAIAPMEEGVAVSSIGSTLAIKILSPSRIDDPSIGLYSHRLGDMWLVGGASNSGGAVLAQFFTPDQIKALSEQIDPEMPMGMDYYPLKVAGERFPINDPDLEPKLTPRPKEDSQFLQAMFEGIARIEQKCYHEIKARGGMFPVQIYTAGGGAQNDKFNAIRARALGVEPLTSPNSEAAIGAARLVFMAG